MADINIGRIRPVFQGDYDPTRGYEILDRVRHEGNIYECCKVAPAGISPDPNSSEYWTPISFKGEKGDTGEKGDPGQDGKDGGILNHRWEGTVLQIENPDGSYDTGVNLKGERGAVGYAPAHEWNETKLKFRNPDGTWGSEVDLKGDKGDQGEPGQGGGVVDGRPYAAHVDNHENANLDDYPEGAILTTDEVAPGGGSIESTPIATIETAGKVKPDGTTIGVEADGTISANKATNGTLGVVKPDNTSIEVNAEGAISVKKATADSLGTVKPDGSTIEIASDGTISSVAPSRNPGELVYSLLPLNDAGLHLLDGSLLAGDGIYKDFVDYVADLYSSANKVSNVKKIGNVVDTDGVLSGFSAENYAKLPLAFNPGSDSWEIVLKVTTGADVSTQQIILASHTKRAVSIGINNSKFILSAGNDTTTWSILSAVSGTYTVLTNTAYWIRAKFDSTKYTLEYSLDGEEFTEDINSTSSALIGPDELNIGIAVAKSSPALCLVDLNESYININGYRWWTGRTSPVFCSEEEFQGSVGLYGACGKFVYDSVNRTVRLPMISGFIEGTLDRNALGELVEAGLPNITGEYQSGGAIGSGTGINSVSSGFIGAFCPGENNAINQVTAANGVNIKSIGFNASLSNSIYGNSTTVQPQAIKGFIYVVVANKTKTQVEADIDRIASDLQLKTELDLSNVNTNGLAKIAHAAMPSDLIISLTVPNTGEEITAPDTGWLVLAGTSSGDNSYVAFGTNGSNKIYQASSGAPSGYAISVKLPVRKGATPFITYGSVTNIGLSFIYSNGSVPE